MRTTTHIGPRRLATQEAVEGLKEQCRRDRSINGRRDLAILSILATGLCNGAELVRIQHSDYNPTTGTLRIPGMAPPLKLDDDCKDAIDLWMQARGDTAGPLLSNTTQPLGPVKPLTASAITWILRKRAQQTGVPYVSSEDLRRSGILERHFNRS
jgi:integrase